MAMHFVYKRLLPIRRQLPFRQSFVCRLLSVEGTSIDRNGLCRLVYIDTFAFTCSVGGVAADGLSVEQKEFQRSAAAFAVNEMSPNMREWDEKVIILIKAFRCVTRLQPELQHRL